MRRSSRLLLFGTSALAVLALAGCRRHAASIDDCQAVLDRIIELELSESGYHDPALRARWQKDLAREFAPDLQRCQRLSVPAGLRHCLGEAHTAEEIVHRCFK